MTRQSIGSIEEILWPGGDRRDIWMILDGARDRRVYSSLTSSYLDYACLYAGDLQPALEVAAPHLVQLEYQDKYTRRILEAGWGDSWGVFLKCDVSLAQLRRHLRHFLIAQDPRGKDLVFRYYDPRVLRVYLPTCFTEELRSLFGAIQFFWTEGQSPGEMLEFGLDRGGLVRRTLPLGAKAPSETPSPGSGRRIEPFVGRMPQRYTTWTIRQAQINAFSQVEVQKFEDWMVQHLNRFFPSQSKSAGEVQLRDTIRYGIRRAASYGITDRRDVCKYIDLAVVLGQDFDTGRRSRWAAQILGQRSSPAVRMKSLLTAAKRQLGNR
jgi:hypothetical protein